jgi:di/tricarboxylate transporter
MTLTAICVIALVAVVATSCLTTANVGLLALAAAWVIGAWVAPAHGVDLTAKAIAGLFPADLFLTLVGVTMLFTVVRSSGTLSHATTAAERLCRAAPALLGPLFFCLAAAVSAAGAGNVPTAAVLAPTAMLAAARGGVSPMVMMVMVGHGAIGGGLSPITPMGVVADEKLTDMGLGGHAGYTFAINFLVNAMVAALGYILFRGWRHAAASERGGAGVPDTWSWRQVASLFAIAIVIVATSGWSVHVGFAALTAATALFLIGCGSERDAFREMPWGVIVMVCGVSVLVALCERTGAVADISRWIAAGATPTTVNAWLAGLTGAVSFFSSTSGVVLPTFLPMVPEVVGQVGGVPTNAALLSAATAINVGSNIVDVSSVSTIGALCVAACPHEAERQRLYRQGLAWGLAMTIAGAAICQAIL